ncbi:MAG: hypothetical protein JKY65_13505 [Planctomycetes bacterium]|nr:hypothetical protein [Planctomycetota bacterium]
MRFPLPLLAALLCAALPCQAQDAADRWVEAMASKRLKAEEIAVGPAIYSTLCLSPDGKALYSHRHREEVDFTNLYDLIRVDLRSGETNVVVDTGSSNWTLDRLKSGVLVAAAVKNHGSHRLLLVREKKVVRAPWGDQVVGGHHLVKGEIVLEDDTAVFGLRGKERVELHRFKGKEGSVRAGAVWRREVIVVEILSDSNKDGKIDYDDLRTYSMLRYEAGFKDPKVADLYQDRKELKMVSVQWLPDGRLLVLENFDSNGDGTADYKDSAYHLRLLDPATRKLTGAISGIWSIRGASLRVHSSGAFLFAADSVDEKKLETRVYVARVGGKPKEILHLTDGEFGSFDVSPDWKTLVFAKVADTDGDGNYYNWKDKSTLYRVSLE